MPSLFHETGVCSIIYKRNVVAVLRHIDLIRNSASQVNGGSYYIVQSACWPKYDVAAAIILWRVAKIEWIREIGAIHKKCDSIVIRL